MFKSHTKKYTDEYDAETFRFTFYCDQCGAAYKSEPIAFTGGEQSQIERDRKVWGLIWQKEHDMAFERANYAARFHFTRCPGCGEYVCEECTTNREMSSGELRPICRDCMCRSLHKDGGHLKPSYMVTGGNGANPSPVQPGTRKKVWSLWKKKDYSGR